MNEKIEFKHKRHALNSRQTIFELEIYLKIVETNEEKFAFNNC
jgi:hypothetical protein